MINRECGARSADEPFPVFCTRTKGHEGAHEMKLDADDEIFAEWSEDAPISTIKKEGKP